MIGCNNFSLNNTEPTNKSRYSIQKYCFCMTSSSTTQPVKHITHHTLLSKCYGYNISNTFLVYFYLTGHTKLTDNLFMFIISNEFCLYWRGYLLPYTAYNTKIQFLKTVHTSKNFTNTSDVNSGGWSATNSSKTKAAWRLSSITSASNLQNFIYSFICLTIINHKNCTHSKISALKMNTNYL